MVQPAETIRNAAQAIWPGASIAERGRDFIRHAHPSTLGLFMLDTTIGPLHIAGTETEINSDWQPTTGAWQYEMVTADFHAFSRDTLGVGTMYRYQHPGTGEYVEFQPLALNWVNDDDSRQQITQPQSVVAQVVNGDILRFPDGYGTGRHFEYQAQTARLKKLITIDSLASLPAPTVTGTPYLEIEFILSKSSGVSEWIDGVEWDRSTKTNTVNRVEFRDSQGNVLWVFDYPHAYDSDSEANQIIGMMQFRRQGNTRYVTVRVPKSWLDTATWPIYLDPTVEPQVSASTDDAFQTAGTVFTNTSGPILNNNDEWSGQRWAVAIDQGASVSVAYVSVNLLSTSFDTPEHDIEVENADNAAAYTTTTNDISARTYQASPPRWSGSNIGTGWKDTPDISANVQATLGRAGWVNGNYMSVGIHYIGGALQHQSYDGDPALAPKLHVEYTAGGGDITINVALSTLVLAGQIVSVSVSGAATIPLALGSLALAPLQVAISASGTATVQVALGTLVLTGQVVAVTPSGTATIAVALGTLTLTGQVVAVTTSGTATVQVALGTLVLSGLAVTVQTGGVTVNVALGSLILAGLSTSVAISGTASIPIALGTLALAGQLVSVVASGTATVPIALGTLILSGQTAAVAVSGTAAIPVALGTLALSGLSSVVSITGTATIPVAIGTLTLSGLAASVVIGTGEVINVALGNLTLTGLSVIVVLYARSGRAHSFSASARAHSMTVDGQSQQ